MDSTAEFTWFDIGAYLLTFVTLLFAVTMMLFLAHISISILHLPLAALATTALTYYSKRNWRSTAIIVGICAAIIIALTIFWGLTFDTTYDGNGYRKIMVGLLRDGWNPVYQFPFDFNLSNPFLSKNIGQYGGTSQWFWIDVYPKAPAVIGACIYILTNNLESGKMFSSLTMVLLFAFYYDYLKARWLSRIQSILIASIIALNPVALSQSRSFYTDAALGNMTMILLLMIVIFFDHAYKVNKNRIFMCIGMIVIWSINIKFNGLLSAGLFCVLFFVVYCIRNRNHQIDAWTKYRVFGFLAGSGLMSIFLGISPYLTNPIRVGEFLPGITGNAPPATGNFAVSTEGLNNIQKFFANIFSRMGDYWTQTALPLKMPFTIAEGEIEWYYVVPPHFGTFGMFFSGLLIVCFIIFIIILWNERQTIVSSQLYIISLFFIVVSTIQCILTPMAIGGLRYVSYFYLFIPYTLILFCIWRNKKKSGNLNTLKCWGPFLAIAILAFTNVAPYIIPVLRHDLLVGANTRETWKQIAQKRANKKVTVAFSNEAQENVINRGYMYNLRDYDLFPINIISPHSIENVIWTCDWQVQISDE